MRCHICNSVLGSKEIKFNKDFDGYEPCSTCLDVIAEVFTDDPDEDEYREGYFEELIDEDEPFEESS